MSDELGSILVGGLLIGAVGGLAWRLTSERDKAEEAERQHRARFGWTPSEIYADTFGQFDRDLDGRVSYDAVTGVRTLGESVSTVTRKFTEPLDVVGMPRGSRVEQEERRTRTLEPALRRADANGDGMVTTAEFMQLITAFDVDRDGKFMAAEHERAMGELGSVVVGTDTRIIRVIPGPAPIQH